MIESTGYKPDDLQRVNDAIDHCKKQIAEYTETLNVLERIKDEMERHMTEDG